jgi:para-nitrobenzyl esterase
VKVGRRRILRTAVTAACTLPWLRIGAAAEPAPGLVQVDTTLGKVEGSRRGATCVFKGIPYGASTSGKGRFRPPRPADPWTGSLPVHTDPPQAPQRDPDAAPAAPQANRFADLEPDWPVLPESEDCLKLDVWTPAADHRRRPVMVYFHGGGFVAGSAAGAWQDGGHLSRRADMVFVSPNHRLNVLGHLFIDRMNPDFAGAGNAGMLDLVLALEWVRDNISRFGGDPDNVMLIGQSGGGQKISMLLAMPRAKGLFHRAIIMSGPAPKALEPAYAEEMAERLLGKLGIRRDVLARLQSLPLHRIMQAYFAVFRETGGFGVLGILQGFAPVVDGTLLPHHPFFGSAPRITANVPLIIGTTRTEMTLNTLEMDPTAWRMDAAGLRQRLAALFGKDTDSVISAYRDHHPRASAWELYALITADWPTRIYSVWIAEAKARLEQAPVFMYRTDWPTPVAGGVLMSPHAIDLAMALDDARYTTAFDGGGPAVARLSNRLSTAWAEFARRGEPSSPLLPSWPRYDPATTRATMLFDTECRVAGDPGGADRRTLETVLARENSAPPGIAGRSH